MVSEQVGSAYVSIGVKTKDLDVGLSSAQGKFNSFGDNAEKRMGKLGDAFGLPTQKIEQMGGALGLTGVAFAGATIAIAATAAAVYMVVDAARVWQDGMAGIQKTTGLTGEALAGMSSKLLDMSTRMPVTAAELQNIASVAGSLGVGVGMTSDKMVVAIGEFTEASAMMAVGFEMDAETAATAAAKILNAYGQPIDATSMMGLGNVVNSLGDSMAATEPQILDFVNRASFLNTTMGLTIPNVAALGATLISLGMDADTAATGIKSALNMGMSENSKTGGLANWADMMGLSVDDLRNKLSTDLNGTMVETANAIAAIQDPTERFQMAVGLFGTEGAPAVLKLAGAQDMMNEAMGTANKEWVSGSSLLNTYAAQSSTLTSRMQILSNTMNMVLVSVGTPMLPWIAGGVDAIQGLIVAGFNAGKALVSISQASPAFGAMVGTVTSLVDTFRTGFGNILLVVTPVWDALGGGSTALGILQAAFNLLTTPLTILWTGLGKLTGGLSALNTALTPVATAFGGSLGSSIKTASAYLQALSESFSSFVSESDRIQYVVGMFQSLQTGVAALGSSFSEISGKVISGLSTAIPKAVDGLIASVAKAFGLSGDAASTAFMDAIADSPLGELLGWGKGIAARAGEIRKQGDTIAAETAKGVKSNDDLKKAGQEVIDMIGSPENLADAERIGGILNDSLLSGFAKQAAISKVDSMTMLGFINNQSTDSDVKEFVYDLHGKVIKYWYDASNSNPLESVSIDGVLINTNQSGNNNPMVGYKKLLVESGVITDSDVSYIKTKNEAAFDKIREDLKKEAAQTVKLGFKFDIAPATKSLDALGPGLTGRFSQIMNYVEGVMASLGAPVYDGVKAKWKGQGQAIADALTQPVTLAGIPAVHKALGALTNEWKSWQITGFAEDTMEAWKAELKAGVADVDAFLKTELERMGGEANTALQDGFISDDDQALFAGFKPQIDVLWEMYPAEMAKLGEDGNVKLIDAIKNGDIVGAYKLIGKEAGSAFANTLVDGYKSVSLKDLIQNPLAAKDISEPGVWASSVGLEELQGYLQTAENMLATGYSSEAVYNYLAPLKNAAKNLPAWFNTAFAELETTIKAGQGQWYSFFQTYNSGATQTALLSKSQKALAVDLANVNSYMALHTTTTKADTTVTKQNTAAVVEMGLAITPLENISSKGIKVNFNDANIVADAATAKLNMSGANFQTDIGLSSQKFGMSLTTSATTSSTKTTTAATTFQSRIDAASLTAQNAIAKAGNPASALVIGAQSAAGMINSAGANFSSLVYAAAVASARALQSKSGAYGPGYATGTKTSGPELAVIGEDGTKYPEYVIPTKTKRWDLLYEAMGAYGIGGFAEGTSTGTGGSGTDPSQMQAYFGITGLAAMSSQVKKNLTDLKDFFRINWGIIRSESATYWQIINSTITTNAMALRDSVWQSLFDIRNETLSADAAIAADVTATWTGIWPKIEPAIKDVSDGIKDGMKDASDSASSEIESLASNVEEQLQNIRSSWSDAWSEMLSELGDTSGKIAGLVSEIAAETSKISVNVSVGSVGGGSGGFGGGTGGSGGTVTGLSSNGYVVTYDPRTDTCDGLAFNAPDPSLKTSDPFYLGLTANSPAQGDWESGNGWGGVVAQPLGGTSATQQTSAQYTDLGVFGTALIDPISSGITKPISQGIQSGVVRPIQQVGSGLKDNVLAASSKHVSDSNAVNSDWLSCNDIVIGNTNQASTNSYNTGMAVSDDWLNCNMEIGSYNEQTNARMTENEMIAAAGIDLRRQTSVQNTVGIEENAANQRAAIELGSGNAFGAIVDNGVIKWDTASTKVSKALDDNVFGLNEAATNLKTVTVSIGGVATMIGVAYSNISGLANRGGGAVFGGTSISGGGAWVGAGSTAVNGAGYTNWGGTAASNAAIGTQSGSWGGVSWGARGYLADQGPEIIGVGEMGPELVLPPDISETVMRLADAGLGPTVSNEARRIVIEDRTTHIHMWNGRVVSNLVMTDVKTQLENQGLVRK